MEHYPEWIRNYMPDNLDKDKWKSSEDKHFTLPEKKEDEDPVGQDERKKIFGPFKSIPNVRKFKVEIGAKNHVLALFGISSKFSPTMKYEPYLNGGMNKYMIHELKSLRKEAVISPEKY